VLRATAVRPTDLPTDEQRISRVFRRDEQRSSNIRPTALDLLNDCSECSDPSRGSGGAVVPCCWPLDREVPGIWLGFYGSHVRLVDGSLICLSSSIHAAPQPEGRVRQLTGSRRDGELSKRLNLLRRGFKGLPRGVPQIIGALGGSWAPFGLRRNPALTSRHSWRSRSPRRIGCLLATETRSWMRESGHTGVSILCRTHDGGLTGPPNSAVTSSS
jgi:hypothetical protein